MSIEGDYIKRIREDASTRGQNNVGLKRAELSPVEQVLLGAVGMRRGAINIASGIARASKQIGMGVLADLGSEKFQEELKRQRALSAKPVDSNPVTDQSETKLSEENLKPGFRSEFHAVIPAGDGVGMTRIVFGIEAPLSRRDAALYNEVNNVVVSEGAQRIEMQLEANKQLAELGISPDDPRYTFLIFQMVNDHNLTGDKLKALALRLNP